MKKLLERFLNAWNARTPKLWKFLRNLAGFITLAVPFLAGMSSSIPNITVPEWFTQYSWYLMAGAGLLTLFAGTRQKKTLTDETAP